MIEIIPKQDPGSEHAGPSKSRYTYLVGFGGMAAAALGAGFGLSLVCAVVTAALTYFLPPLN